MIFLFFFYIVLRGWLTRRKYARLREIHQLQLVFIRKFSEDICSTGQLYKTKMDNHCQYDKKRKLKQKSLDEDDEQIEKTLNFFDSIIDPYLHDQETHEENKIKLDRKISNPIKTNGHPIKQEFDVKFSIKIFSLNHSLISGEYLDEHKHIFFFVDFIIAKSSATSC